MSWNLTNATAPQLPTTTPRPPVTTIIENITKMVTDNLMNITNSNKTNGTSQPMGREPSSEITVGKYIIIVVCFISAIVGMSGNLVIIIVRIFKQFQRGSTTAYTFLICQLAIADFIFAFTITFDINSYLHNDIWAFGTDSCKLIKLLQSSSLTTTVGFLTIMAYERYCGISRPLQHRWSIKKTFFIVLMLWFYTFLTFIPFATALDVQYGYCAEYKHPSEEFRKGYTMFLFVTNYILPLISIIVFHTLIVYRMKKHIKAMRTQRHRGSPGDKRQKMRAERMRKMSATSTYSMGEEVGCRDGENCWVVVYRLLRETFVKLGSANNDNNNSNFSRSESSRKSNVFKKLISRSKTNEDKKLIKMLVAVTMSFAVMTLPTQIYYIWYDFGGGGHSVMDKNMLLIIEVFSSLVYLHCCSNCIIYSAMDKKFRADVEKTFRFLFNCQKKTKLSRTSFQRVTMMSHISRFSRHSTSTTNSSKKSDDALLRKQAHLQVIPDEDNKVFSFQKSFERETVIM